LLDYIVEECSKYATSLPDGWMWVTIILHDIISSFSLINYWKSHHLHNSYCRLLLYLLWYRTYLYSLTKQDVALIDVPGMYKASRPIMHYIKHTIEMYAVVKKTVCFDRNQPHVLKYSADDKSKHTGVEVSSMV
jgi:hypothetical protein